MSYAAPREPALRLGVAARASATPAASDPTTSQTAAAPVPSRVTIELDCLQCGRPLGTLESTVWPPTGPMTWHAAVGSSPLRVTCGGLRCATCGGNAVPITITRRPLIPDVKLDWSADEPRRGRPPKWLAEMRHTAQGSD